MAYILVTWKKPGECGGVAAAVAYSVREVGGALVLIRDDEVLSLFSERKENLIRPGAGTLGYQREELDLLKISETTGRERTWTSVMNSHIKQATDRKWSKGG